MANIIPFRGVLYDPAVVGDVGKVVAPPYDVIDTAFQQALHARHPQNVIRLELGLDEPGDDGTRNRYSRAAASLGQWLQQGALRRDAEPAVYPYSIEYRPPSAEPGGPARTLRGFLSRVQLEEFGSGRIFPHENTRSAAKADRLKLMESCRANFSPIFSLFSDAERRVLSLIDKSVDADRPRIDFRDDEGFRHRLWAITDPGVLGELTVAMRPKPLFIADGHHRYETALTYRKQRREAAGSPTAATSGPQPSYDSVLMLFSSLEDPGLTVLPTHRVLTKPLPAPAEIKRVLRDGFEIEEFAFKPQSESEIRRRFLRTLRSRGQSEQLFGLAVKDISAYFLIALRPAPGVPLGQSPQERLDVSILHNYILNKVCPGGTDDIRYTKDDNEAMDLVRRGEAPASLLLNPTKVSEVRAVAASGGRMPHKSTYFFPKPLTGLVLNVFEE